LVSVIIPAYNAQDWIAETLDSVQAQTHRALEIIIVDDGSRDATKKIATRYMAGDVRIRLLEQVNSGVAAARNHGAAEARSDLLAFVDADDLWAPDKIERQLAALDAAGPAAGLCYSWYLLIDEESIISARWDQQPHAGKVLDRLFLSNFVGNGSSALVRRKAFEDAGGFEPALHNAGAQGCEDILFYCRVAAHHEFAVVPDYLVGYRELSGNMSSNIPRMLRSWMLVSKEMKNRHPNKQRLIEEGARRYIVWLTRRAIHRRSPGAVFSIIADTMMHQPKLAARLALIEAPRTLFEPLLRRYSGPAGIGVYTPPPADDRFAPGRRFNAT
jgi:glycosyltransferase involved in cell wall biosynthesis